MLLVVTIKGYLWSQFPLTGLTQGKCFLGHKPQSVLLHTGCNGAHPRHQDGRGLDGRVEHPAWLRAVNLF